MRKKFRLATEVKDQGMKIEGCIPKIGEASGQAMEVDEEDLESGKEIKIRIIKNLLVHKI